MHASPLKFPPGARRRYAEAARISVLPPNCCPDCWSRIDFGAKRCISLAGRCLGILWEARPRALAGLSRPPKGYHPKNWLSPGGEISPTHASAQKIGGAGNSGTLAVRGMPCPGAGEARGSFLRLAAVGERRPAKVSPASFLEVCGDGARRPNGFSKLLYSEYACRACRASAWCVANLSYCSHVQIVDGPRTARRPRRPD
jgi:hypothetical protein